MKRDFDFTFWVMFLVITIIIQPLLLANLEIYRPIVPVAQAAIDKPEEYDPPPPDDPAEFDAGDTTSGSAADFIPTDLTDLQTLDDIQGNLQISPTDVDQLKASKVDVRVTDYLMNLVLPTDDGGAGMSHVKVNRIFKNYTSQGIGKYDREGVNATVADEGNVISGHNRGQAVDISEVGEVTCKLVEKHHIGPDTTHWQKPVSVKVAWQSAEGAKNSPTPTAQSILGAAGDMSSQGILNYLNASGQMDYTVDYVKGMDLKTIASYVGANVFQKYFGVNQVLSDPFADGLLHALGGAVIGNALPGLPPGIAGGNSNDDARVAFAKSRLEQGLNLPSGSLGGGSGWDNILQSTGKRSLETSLGLPQGYFDKHTLDDANKLDGVKNILTHFVRADNGLNLMTGTVDAFKAKDPNSFKMAGVTILESAFHLPNNQKALLESAVKARQTPTFSLESAPVGEVISPTDLTNFFSSDGTKQKAAEESFKKIGIQLITSAATKAIPNKYSGLTDLLLKKLLDSKQTVKLGDLTTSVGASTIGIQTGVNDAGLDKSQVNAQELLTSQAANIADAFNADNSLSGLDQIAPQDISDLFNGDGTGVAEKLGSKQLDQAFGWNSDTTSQVINNQKNLADASFEIFNNQFGGDIGTKSTDNTSANTTTDLTSDAQLYDFFDIGDQDRPDPKSVQTLIKVHKSKGVNISAADLQIAKQTILQLVGRSVDSKANFVLDTFTQYISSPNPKAATDLLLNQGIRLISQTLGINSQGLSFDDIEKGAKAISDTFNIQGDQIEFDSGTGASTSSGSSGSFRAAADFILRTTGIPVPFRQDAEAILRGDWRHGIAAASFATLLPQINAFMPKNDLFSYDLMRQALTIDNPALIDARINQIAGETPGFSDFLNPNFENVAAVRQIARRQLMEEAQKNIEYRTSDSLLRKLDPAIPVGFSKIMYSGTSAERGDLLQAFAFGKLDVELSKLSPLYVPGMLKDLYAGKIPAGGVDSIVLNVINRSGVSFGSFSTEFVSNFYQFIRTSDRSDFFTNAKYQSTWSYFDGWVAKELDIGVLPDGLTKSIYYTSQHGWNLDANLKNGDQVLVQSVNVLAKDFLVNRLSAWGDKNLGLPVGSVYKVYQLTTAFIHADQLLAQAHIDQAFGTGTDQTVSDAQGAENAARNAVILFAISLALNACSACQKFFSSVDQAIAAPPGFTQALLLASIGYFFLGMGPAAFATVAAIYLFGAYKVVYLCPTPPQDVFAIPEYDAAADITDFGVPYDQLPDDPNLITSSPPPGFIKSSLSLPASSLISASSILGQPPSTWKTVDADGNPTDVLFSDGNDSKLWQGWARFYAGKLIQATMDYGIERQSPNKPVQLLTYRQANTEYFTPQSIEAFGEQNFGNPNFGLGFTQDSTKTTDWVHVGFGGLY